MMRSEAPLVDKKQQGNLELSKSCKKALFLKSEDTDTY